MRPEGKAIDWDSLRTRLAQGPSHHDEGARARSVLEERTRALALPVAAPYAGQELEVLTFALANEQYALETRHIREVARLVDFARVPGTPDFVVGVTSLRGEILTIVDLRKLFGIPVRGVTDLSRILVLGSEGAELGVLADAAHEVTRFRLEEVIEPPASVAGISREYVRGLTKDALIVLDGDALLSDRRLFVDQGSHGAPGAAPENRGKQ